MTIDPVSLAITVALTAANMALTMSQTIEGPRVTDLEGTVADYGTPLNYLYGSKRVGCPCFFMEPMKERRKKRKTKGGKYNEYTYYGTFACVAADHQIAQVKRIWFDSHLIYDIDQGGVIFNLGNGYDFTSKVRFHLGTEDQEPDERMLATIEAAEGVGMCPAYLGVGYIFFEDVPLEKLGNRFPQVSAEVSTVTSDLGGADSYIHVDVVDTFFAPDFDYDDPAFTSEPYYVSTDQHYAIASGYTVYVIDHVARELVYKWHSIPPYTGFGNDYFGFTPYGIDSEGTAWGNSAGYREFVQLDMATPTAPVVRAIWTDNGGNAVGGRIRALEAFDLPGGAILVVVLPSADGFGENHTFKTYIKGSGILSERDTTESGIDFAPYSMFQDDLGDVWLTGAPSVAAAAQTVYYLWRITDVTSGDNPYGPLITVTDLPDVDTTGGLYINTSRLNGFFADGYFVGVMSGTEANIGAISYRVRIPMAGGASTAVAQDGVYVAPHYQIAPGTDYFMIREFNIAAEVGSRAYLRINTADLSITREYDLSIWNAPDYEFSPLPADPATLPDSLFLSKSYIYSQTAFVSHNSDFWYNSTAGDDYATGVLRYYIIPTTAVVTLKTVVDDISRRVGLDLSRVYTDAIGTTL